MPPQFVGRSSERVPLSFLICKAEDLLIRIAKRGHVRLFEILRFEFSYCLRFVLFRAQTVAQSSGLLAPSTDAAIWACKCIPYVLFCLSGYALLLPSMSLILQLILTLVLYADTRYRLCLYAPVVRKLFMLSRLIVNLWRLWKSAAI